MTTNRANLFIRLLRQQRQRQVWFRWICILAMVVMIGVTYALTLPAVTMENDIVCGMEEHTHSEECYELRDGEQVLICTLNEHTHDEHCLAAAQVPEEPDYLCGFTYEHQHDPSCYADGVLICTMQQHTHSDACLDPSTPQPVQEEPPVELTAEQPKNEKDPNDIPPAEPDSLEGEDDLLESPAIYEDIQSQPEANVSLKFFVNEREVNPNHFYNEASYVLNISNVELPSYDGTIFYCRLPAGDYDLYVGDKQNTSTIQSLTQENPGSTESVYFWADKSEDDYYTIYILPKPGTEIVYKVSISGLTLSHLSQTSLEITKTSDWNPLEMAYEYDIAVRVPAYGNFLDQAYSIFDRTSIGREVFYSPFAAATRGKNFTATIQTGSQSEQPLRPIEEVYLDPSVHVAYYEKGGIIYLLNRTTHTGSCLTRSPTNAYPGWCACWAQEEESEIHISYIDTYAQNQYAQYPNKSINNRAVASDQNSKEVSSEVQNPIPVLLNKGFNPVHKRCTITLNESMMELSGELQITDHMEDAYFNGGLQVIASNGSETRTLTKDVDYTFALDEDGFILTILDAGAYEYTVSYNVEKENTEDPNAAPVNTVSINNSYLTETVGMSFDYMIDSGSYGCEISIVKTYGSEYDADGSAISLANPAEGAEFRLYKPTGEWIASSKTENGVRYIETAAGRRVQTGQTAYTPGGESDLILFNTEAGIRCGRLFYIQEYSIAPEYQLDKTKYYFFVTSFSEADTIATPITSVDIDGQTCAVEVFDNWNLVSNPNNTGVLYYFLSDKFMAGTAEKVILNDKNLYVLPETGGVGSLPYFLGVGLIAFCLCFQLRRRRRTKRAS